MCWIQGRGFGILGRTYTGVYHGKTNHQKIHAPEYYGPDHF